MSIKLHSLAPSCRDRRQTVLRAVLLLIVVVLDSGNMLGLTLTALARYHRQTQDPEVLAAVTAGIDQMIRETWSEEHKSFYLTSCTHSRSTPPAFSSVTMHASEAFAYEAKLTGNREHQRIMREALRSALAGGRNVITAGETVGQTGYYSGMFLFPPFALEALDE